MHIHGYLGHMRVPSAECRVPSGKFVSLMASYRAAGRVERWQLRRLWPGALQARILESAPTYYSTFRRPVCVWTQSEMMMWIKLWDHSYEWNEYLRLLCYLPRRTDSIQFVLWGDNHRNWFGIRWCIVYGSWLFYFLSKNWFYFDIFFLFILIKYRSCGCSSILSSLETNTNTFFIYLNVDVFVFNFLNNILIEFSVSSPDLFFC